MFLIFFVANRVTHATQYFNRATRELLSYSSKTGTVASKLAVACNIRTTAELFEDVLDECANIVHATLTTGLNESACTGWKKKYVLFTIFMLWVFPNSYIFV